MKWPLVWMIAGLLIVTSMGCAEGALENGENQPRNQQSSQNQGENGDNQPGSNATNENASTPSNQGGGDNQNQSELPNQSQDNEGQENSGDNEGQENSEDNEGQENSEDNEGQENSEDNEGQENDGQPCDGVSCPSGVCDPVTGDCVECLDSADCGAQVCDESVSQCVECLDSADCGDDVCDQATSQCVECANDGDCDPGVCDESQSVCVECEADGDCPEGLSCDGANSTCLECTSDADCEGAAKCHDEYPTCVADCCDFVVEDVFSNVSYSHYRFDIAVDPEGEPAIVFADSDSDEIRFAHRLSNGGWTYQVPGDFSGSSIEVRLDFDGDGQPHIMARYASHWQYLYRDGSTWEQEDVWDEELSYSEAELVVDSEGSAHFVGAGEGLNEIFYAKYSATQQQWSRQSMEYGGDGTNLNWFTLGLMSDDSPVIGAYESNLYDENVRNVVVATEVGGSWAFEVVGEGRNFIYHMTVGSNDEIMVVHRPHELPHDGLELTQNGSGSWATQSINSESHAGTVHFAIDDRQDPHIIFNISGSGQFDNFLAYTRWDGNQWQTQDVSESLVERAFFQRIATDHDHVAHIVVYDSDRDTISYVTVE